MVSLGILPAIGTGTYPLPPTFNQSLAPYTTVDVSVEANDGNSAHSQDSLVRGSLAGQ